jgi:hypothetical protein
MHRWRLTHRNSENVHDCGATHDGEGATGSEPDGDSDSGRMGDTMNSCVSNIASTSMGGRTPLPVM